MNTMPFVCGPTIDTQVDFINQMIPKLLEMKLEFTGSSFNYYSNALELSIHDTIADEQLTFYVPASRIYEWSTASNFRAQEYFIDLIVQDLLLEELTIIEDFTAEELASLTDETEDLFTNWDNCFTIDYGCGSDTVIY